MAYEIVHSVWKRFTSIFAQEVHQKIMFAAGVTREAEKFASNFKAILAVLNDAQAKDAQAKEMEETRVREWLNKVKDISYDMDDVLDAYNTTFLKLQNEKVEKALNFKVKVCFFFYFPHLFSRIVSLCHQIAIEIKEMNKRLDAIAKDEQMKSLRRGIERFERLERFELKLVERVPSTSFVDVSEICGRVEDKSTLVSKLCENSNVDLHIISIVGMGGIGKTTLAQYAYNDKEVINNFDILIWVCVSDPFDEHRIARAIIESLECSPTNLVEFNSLIEKIHKCIQGKKFLLVLDDVWIEVYDKWEPFHHCLKNGLHGSKILITTCKKTVAYAMNSIDIIPIQGLSEEECWLLFKQLAFFDRSSKEYENLEEIGRKIIMKCKGLPLAAKIIASLLRFEKRREEWENILEEFEKKILPPLLLGYNDLPSSVEQCFSYCSIFPKDYEFNKDELINLWMAQGYLVLEENKEMEIIGQNYFENLASRSFFQEFEKDNDGNIIGGKMPNIVHDFAQYLRKGECCMVEVNEVEKSFTNSPHEKIRHLMLKLNKGASFPVPIRSAKKLRSLLVKCDNSINSLPNDVLQILFGELTCLRALMLYSSGDSNYLMEIPKELEKMMHLRYLNLSRADVTKLPESLCKLYNLQTLDINWCDKLKELPQGMGNLINLRHLINDNTDSLSYMPIGMERLTSLRRLSEFVVSDVGDHNRKACSVYCLKDLKHLQGDIYIRGLGNVTNVSEVKRIKILENKKNLFSLYLVFNKDEKDREGNIIEAAELLLEDLQPPPSLKKLTIVDYRGNTFYSNWVTSSSKLRELELWNCHNCKHLPPLGKLMFLESLDISGMKSVKRVGNEFWGIESDITSSSIILFPELKSLEFWEMSGWEEWDFGITSKREEEEEQHVTIMPSLTSLSIRNCPKLKALPPLGKLSSLESLNIGGMESVKRVGNEFLGIESDITSSSIILFPKLKSLEFWEMSGWKEWDFGITSKREEEEHVTIMPSLTSLSIGNCSKLKALPDCLLQSTTLKELTINGCPTLIDRYRKEKGQDWAKISHIPTIQIFPW